MPARDLKQPPYSANILAENEIAAVAIHRVAHRFLDGLPIGLLFEF